MSSRAKTELGKSLARDHRRIEEELRDERHEYNDRYRRYIGSAVDRKIPFKITVDQFNEITSKPCYLCGAEPDGLYNLIGVDRIDSTKGYTLDNCAPCCGTCNWMKRNYPLNDYLLHIIKSYWHISNSDFFK